MKHFLYYYLCKNCSVIWRLIFFFFMGSAFLHLFSVCFLLPVCPFWLKIKLYKKHVEIIITASLLPIPIFYILASIRYLKNFDLAAGWMQMICIFSVFSLLKSVNLNPKRNSFFSSMFTGCKFSTDAMDLKNTQHQHLIAQLLQSTLGKDKQVT